MGSKKLEIPRARGRTALPVATAVVVLMMAASVAMAQSPVRAWGMGGAGASVARGLEAVTFNPANLAFSSGTTVGLLGAAVAVENNALSLDRYNEITGTHLDAAAEDKLLSEIPGDGLRLDADVRASALGVQSGSFAFTAGAMAAGRGNLDKDYFDLVLNGNRMGQTVDFSNTWGDGYAMGAAGVSYATRLVSIGGASLGAGVSLRYLHGVYEMHVDEAGGTLTTGMTDITADAFVSTLSAEGGRGYGMDLGLALQTAGSLSFGLSLENVQGRMDWDRNVERREFRVTAGDINLMNSDLDASVTDADSTYAADPYTTTLPKLARLGASTKLGSFLVAADWVQGFENRGLVSTDPRILTGLEWQLGFVKPRLGVASGGVQGDSASAGLGLKMGFWNIDVAAVTRGGLRAGDAKGVGVAMGSSLTF